MKAMMVLLALGSLERAAGFDGLDLRDGEIPVTAWPGGLSLDTRVPGAAATMDVDFIAREFKNGREQWLSFGRGDCLELVFSNPYQAISGYGRDDASAEAFKPVAGSVSCDMVPAAECTAGGRGGADTDTTITVRFTEDGPGAYLDDLRNRDSSG